MLYVIKWSFYQEHISHDDRKCITCIWRNLNLCCDQYGIWESCLQFLVNVLVTLNCEMIMLWPSNWVTLQLLKFCINQHTQGKEFLNFWNAEASSDYRQIHRLALLICDISCSAVYPSNEQVTTTSSYSQNVWFSYLIWLINVLITGWWNTLPHTSHSWYSTHVSTCRTLLTCRLKFLECHFL